MYGVRIRDQGLRFWLEGLGLRLWFRDNGDPNGKGEGNESETPVWGFGFKGDVEATEEGKGNIKWTPG